MRTHALFAIGLLSAALPFAATAQVHKCITADSVVYRDTPCDAGHAHVVLIKAKTAPRIEHSPPVSTSNTARTDAAATANSAASASYFAETPLPAPGTAISLGMSDLEVLNLRGWGRPSKINRTKVNGVWREQWVYAAATGPLKPVLQFANGKLAAIDSEPVEAPLQQAVRVTSNVTSNSGGDFMRVSLQRPAHFVLDSSD